MVLHMYKYNSKEIDNTLSVVDLKTGALNNVFPSLFGLVVVPLDINQSNFTYRG